MVEKYSNLCYNIIDKQKVVHVMYYIGIDIGGMSVKIGVVSDKGKIKISRSIPTEADSGYEVMVKRMAETIEEICSEINLNTAELKGIGMGIPGTADSKIGMVTVATNIGWRNVPIVAEMRKYFNIPIKINNDANCAALGEQRFGGGAEFDSVIFITLGTGVGSGIIYEGNLIEGVGSAGAESGHMVIQVDGEPCNCGRSGCWESYASATALIKQTKRAMENYPNSLMHDIFRKYGKVSGRTAFLAASEGDIPAKQVVERYIKYIAIGLINLGNIVHPNAFIMGGGISHEGESLIKPLQKYLDNYCYGSGLNPAIKVCQAVLGNDAGIVGAAALVM